MPLSTGSHRRTPLALALDLPPPFREVRLREVGDAFAHAMQIAGEAGAGTLVHVGRFDIAEFAVVVEPEEPLAGARRVLYAGLSALADALAVRAPPKKPLSFDWPDAIRVDGGLIGGARLGWPPDAEEAAAPAWLVFGAMIRIAVTGAEEAGVYPFAAALEAEGFELGSGLLLESFARHLMAAIDTWQQEGFGKLASSYLYRLAPEAGVHCEIDDNGDLLVRGLDGSLLSRRPLLPALATPSWLDLATGAPRL